MAKKQDRTAYWANRNAEENARRDKRRAQVNEAISSRTLKSKQDLEAIYGDKISGAMSFPSPQKWFEFMNDRSIPLQDKIDIIDHWEQAENPFGVLTQPPTERYNLSLENGRERAAVALWHLQNDWYKNMGLGAGTPENRQAEDRWHEETQVRHEEIRAARREGVERPRTWDMSKDGSDANSFSHDEGLQIDTRQETSMTICAQAEMQVAAIRVVTELDKSFNQRRRDNYGRENADTYEPTQANFAYAMDLAAYHNVSLSGQFGAQRTWVEIDFDNGDKNVIVAKPDNDEPDPGNEAHVAYWDAMDAISDRGSVERAALVALSDRVWDGNCWVTCIPKLSQEYCDQQDIESKTWGTVIYTSSDNSRIITDMSMNSDWIELAWYDYAGYEAGELYADEFELLREMINPPAGFDQFWVPLPGEDPNWKNKVAQFSHDQSECQAYFCRREHLDEVLANIRRRLEEDD